MDGGAISAVMKDQVWTRAKAMFVQTDFSAITGGAEHTGSGGAFERSLSSISLTGPQAKQHITLADISSWANNPIYVLNELFGELWVDIDVNVSGDDDADPTSPRQIVAQLRSPLHKAKTSANGSQAVKPAGKISAVDQDDDDDDDVQVDHFAVEFTRAARSDARLQDDRPAKRYAW